MLMRQGLLSAVVVVVGLLPTAAFGQNTAPAQTSTPIAAAVQNQADVQKPPAAVGEEGKKPTRGFFSALGHNLGDDVRHIPRRNSLYWLGSGAALALAVHPADTKVNAHLVGHSNPFVAGETIGETPTLLGAAAATYLFGRMKSYPRAQHIGMDEIEAVLLAEGDRKSVV